MARKQKFNGKNSKETNNQGNRSERTNYSKDQDKSSNVNKERKSGDSSFGAPKPQLLNDVARVSFENALGRVENLKDGSTPVNVAFSDHSAPGVAAIHFVPMFGVGKTASDAYNVSANVLYTDIRHNKSGTAIYTAPDLMMYFAGADSMYSFWAFMVRTYGLLSTYSAKNWYYPRALVEASGLNFENLMSNLANFREYINQYALRISIYHIPNNLPIFSRHMELLSKVFMDGNNDKAQSYIYVPEGFYRLDETGSSTGGRLVFERFLTWRGGIGTAKTLNQIIAYGDILYNSMNRSEDMNIIMADVRYAFDSAASISPVLIDPQYRIVPEYNPDVLAMIHNLTINGRIINFEDDTFDITQDGGSNTIKCSPILNIALGEEENFADIKAVVHPALNKKFLDVRELEVNEAGVMMITREQTVGKLIEDTAQNVKLEITASGPELITDIDIVSRNSAGGFVYTPVEGVYERGDIGTVIAETIPFYHFPFLYSYNKQLGITSVAVKPVGMIDNYSSVDSEMLTRMHTTNWAYQYNVPTDNLK